MGVSAAQGSAGLKPGVCTSTTRPSNPFEGQMIYETDTDLSYIYNGSSWQQVSGGTAVGNSGLVYITSATIGTGVSTVEVLSAFNTTYDAYKIVATGVTGATGAESISMTLGNSGGYTSTGYDSGMIFNLAGTAVVANGNASAWNFVGAYSTTTGMPLNIDVYSPFAAHPTSFSSVYMRADAYGTPTGTLTGTTSYDRFTITVVAGTITGGTIAIYGYRKA